MLEFTMSRVAVFVCGAIILTAVIVPVSGMYDSKADADMIEVADRAADVMDSFWYSDVDVMTLRGWDILPSTDCVLEIEGHDIILQKNGRIYRGLISFEAGPITFSYNQIMTVEKENGRLICTIID